MKTKSNHSASLREHIQQAYKSSPLATKIRFSYMLLLVPMLVLLGVCVFNLWNSNKRYDSIVNSAAIASDFSLDFKKDFDYETYLLIVGNKTIEESSLDSFLEEAYQILDKLEAENPAVKDERLTSARKYLDSLSVYKSRIEENILEGNKYENNLQIWENDIQIVTGLLRETILQYIYYEIRDIQQTRQDFQQFNMVLINSLIFAAMMLTIIMLLLSYYLPQSITKPIRELGAVTDEVASGNLSVRANTNAGAEVEKLSASFNSMIDKINELLDQVTTEQIRLRNAELALLQSQINPHFLYNTLDTIVWLAEAGEQKQVVSMVESLSKFFRTSLSQGKDVVKISEELLHVRSYLEIQQMRYQDILEYEIDVPDELSDYLIPKITIQPIVENALYHGIKNKRGLGKITITGEKLENSFRLTISDNGIGMNKERLEKVLTRIYKRTPNENEIYGLYNVNERIRLKFGQEYGIRINSVDKECTTVIIHLPCRTLEESS